MLTADRHMLARISAALNADPFADPVSVCGVALPRVDARRFERELVVKVYPAARGSQADALPNAGVGRPSPDRQRPAGAPARTVMPSNLSGSGLRLDRGFHTALSSSQVQYDPE